MVDYRMIGRVAQNLAPLPDNDDWTARWHERNHWVRSLLGDTVPPGVVHSFSWKDYILPGACAMTFRGNAAKDDFLCMTLGVTHPLTADASSFPWEFCVRTKNTDEWPIDLLYQLVTHWLSVPGEVWFGYELPLQFFVGKDGKLWASISERFTPKKVVGAIRNMYLWVDAADIAFGPPSDRFGLLTTVAVTGDEKDIAEKTTPAHLMLLLRNCGITQLCDPYRQSVLRQPCSQDAWSRIARLSHEMVLDELQASSSA